MILSKSKKLKKYLPIKEKLINIDYLYLIYKNKINLFYIKVRFYRIKKDSKASENKNIILIFLKGFITYIDF